MVSLVVRMVPLVVGFQHHTDDARGVGSLNEEFQVLRQLGRLPNGLKLNPLHIEQRPDVRPAVAGLTLQ